MRFAWLFVVVAGCGAGQARGPAWPKPSSTETDGGEPLAPRTASAVTGAAAAEQDDELESKPVTPSVTKPAAGAAPAAATATPATTTPTDEPITTEDIVIEIDD